MKRFLSLSLIGSVLWLTNCKKEDEVAPVGCDGLTVRASAVSGTAQSYAANFTKSNCDAYRAALTAYIQAGEQCPGTSSTDLANAKAALAALKCQ